MKTKVSELSGIALDWAVAKCEGYSTEIPEKAIEEGIVEFDEFDGVVFCPPDYSSDWSQGGPIIERERIDLAPLLRSRGWCSFQNVDTQYEAKTPLIAAMRCYVASKLGEEVDIPDEVANHA